MPFDKSRHLCLQAFPTSILRNGGSLRVRHAAQDGSVDRSSSGTARHAYPHDALYWEAEDAPVQVTQQARSLAHMRNTDFLWSICVYIQSSGPSRCCSASKPPVESAHRHCGAVRCPRCWDVRALRCRTHAPLNPRHHVDRRRLMSWRLRAATSWGKVGQDCEQQSAATCSKHELYSAHRSLVWFYVPARGQSEKDRIIYLFVLVWSQFLFHPFILIFLTAWHITWYTVSQEKKW